jgi:hypothetical protein
MELEHRNHDDAIDKTLAALKTATPPDGMEARILQRLQQQPAPAAPLCWRDLLTGSALAAAWWRGAISGVATAMLLVGALLFAQHTLRTKQPAISNSAASHNLAPTPVSVAASAGCPTHAQVHRAWVGSTTRETIHAQVHRAWVGSTASFAPSHPAPVQPLTAQERALIQLARTADPRLLASLTPETQAKLAAQQADDYNKFFAPPPAPPMTDVNLENQPAPKEGEQI